MTERRDEILILRVSPSDKDRIRMKMEELGISNMSAYIRKMALDGYCVNLDLTDVKELVHLLRQCSVLRASLNGKLLPAQSDRHVQFLLQGRHIPVVHAKQRHIGFHVFKR